MSSGDCLGSLCFIDVESTGLDAESSFIVGYGLMRLDGSWIHSFARTIDDESKIIVNLMNNVREYECIVTWYGLGFDIPIVTARAVKNGIDPSPILTVNHIDLFIIFKTLFRLSKYDLDSVCKFLGIPKRVELKGSDMPPLYFKALSGDSEALKLIEEHCYDDLQGLRSIYLKVEGIVNKIIGGCIDLSKWQFSFK